jgi:hypothetical protein
MTFADLVNNLDKAVAPMLVVLEKAGQQFMLGPNNTVQVFTRDASALGFRVDVATKADQTEVTITGLNPTTPVGAQLAAAQAQINAAAQGA